MGTEACRTDASGIILARLRLRTRECGSASLASVGLAPPSAGRSNDRTVARVVTSLVVFALFAELLGLIAYYADTGALFYTIAKPTRSCSHAGGSAVPGRSRSSVLRLHAQTGSSFRHSGAAAQGTAIPARLHTNNFGFVSPHEYPFKKARDDQFIVGIFGGSVGLWFCQVGAPRLVEQMKRDAFFSGKEIVPLCFSHEGYKQPQEAVVLAYFLSIGQRVRPGGEHRRLQRRGAGIAQQRARPRFLDAQRAAPRSAHQRRQPVDADARQARDARRDLP